MYDLEWGAGSDIAFDAAVGSEIGMLGFVPQPNLRTDLICVFTLSVVGVFHL